MDSENQMNFGGCKGVMLCNRPFGGLDGGGNGRLKRTMPLNEASSFICGTVKRPWGSNVAISEKERVLNRLSQKNEVLNRHRKWLHDLQKRKEERAKNCLREEEERESRKRRFMENEAKKRAIVRGELFTDVSKNYNEPVSSSDDDENIIDYEEYESKEKSICSLTDEKEEAFDSEKFDYRESSSKENLKKPKWAMTERIAADVQRDKENIEEKDLLEFVHALDFDKFSEDMELRMLMEQVKERIQSLEREKDKETERLQVVEDVEMVNLRSDKYAGETPLNDFLEKKKNEGIAEDLESVADTVASNQSIRSIHSQKSMSVLISRAKEKVVALEPVYEEPISIVHTDDDGRRLAETKSLNKLPFKNRNPAL